MIESNLVSAYRYQRGISRTQRDGSRLAMTPAVEALALARADVVKGVRRYYSRDYGPGTRQPDSPHLFAAHDETAQGIFRHVGDVETEGRGSIWQNGRHGRSGWYCDPFGDYGRDGDGLAWGVVLQLNGRRGMSRFVAGYVYGGVDGGPMVDLSEIFEERVDWHGDAAECDAAHEAARAANHLAEHAAEAEREYQSAWQSGSRFASLGEEIDSERTAALVLLRERRAVRGDPAAFPAICAAIRGSISDALDSIQKARAERGRLREGDEESLYFFTGENRLREAFNEGAGADVLTVNGVK